MRKVVPAALIGLAILACTGCGRPVHSSALETFLDQRCLVLFRRDALGYATDKDNGVSCDIFLIGARRLGAEGTLKAFDAEWLLLETGAGLQAIPQDAVLSIHDR